VNKIPLFAPELDLIELFLRLIGDKQLDVVSNRITLVPAPTRSNALAAEILASAQAPLLAAYWGAVQWPGKDGAFLYAHDPCNRWQILTKARAKSICGCDDKTPRRQIPIPWLTANKHGRPKANRTERSILK
jgi:hypothetical protein